LHHEPPPTAAQFYRIGRLLGKGAFGKVNLGMHKLTGKMVAIKSINKEYLTDEHSKNKVMQEFSILKQLHHPSVIRLYDSFESTKHILFVMELCAGGDLLNYVRKRKRVKENMAKFIFKQLIDGLQHCHSRGILHRDIKLDNVLLNAAGDLKVCDFGVSKIVRAGERMTEQCGTPAYIAPEILRDQGYEGFGVDVWSAGVALFAMLYGTVPFKANNMHELHRMILKGRYNLKEDISDQARDLLKRMLECDPRKRITIPEIYDHDWMRDVELGLSLFSDAETEAINKEYTYRRKGNGEAETNTLFTEQNIDSTQNDLTRNITAKSIILAPFNTTQTHATLERDAPIYENKREVIRFAAKVRDVDRQYEKNNNGELDNGVYNKFVCASSEDKRSMSSSGSSGQSFREDKRSSDKLPNSFADDGARSPAPVKSPPHPQGPEKRAARAKSPEASRPVVESPAPALSKPRLLKPIDEDILQKVETLGYPRDYLVGCLKNNERNYATTTYYLMANNCA
jgi:serine/threonine protein kinase